MRRYQLVRGMPLLFNVKVSVDPERVEPDTGLVIKGKVNGEEAV